MSNYINLLDTIEYDTKIHRLSNLLKEYEELNDLNRLVKEYEELNDLNAVLIKTLKDRIELQENFIFILKSDVDRLEKELQKYKK